MNLLLLLGALVLTACLIGSKLSHLLRIPTLFFFIALGMLFGSDGLLKIEFSDYALSEQLCSAALIFIMFYGGFGTKWNTARPVAVKSILLSTFGVLITAGLTGLFCYFFLGFDLMEGMLIGAVLGSTDAASVFSILRSQKLNLKYGTAPMLEIESGSNDPCAYTLTVILLSAMGGSVSVSQIAYVIFSQIVYGMIAGVAIALLAGWAFRNFLFEVDGFDSIFLVAVALASYAIPSLLGGNGYLSAYIAGILLGNQDLPRKKNMANFFDAFNGMMQMFIFFLLGLLVFPSQLPQVLLPSIAIALFLTLVARPASIAALLTPFRAPLKQQLVVSWAGLRGAASIVFSIVAAVSPSYGQEYIFHIVFCVVLLSILFQGTLLPLVAQKADMIDARENVLKTFNTYSEETSIHFIQVEIHGNHPWKNQLIKDVQTIPGTLIAAIIRDKKAVLPKGNTCLLEGDTLIIGAKEYSDNDSVELIERKIDAFDQKIGRPLREIDIKKNALVVLIQRDGSEFIPDGDTVLCEGDNLILYSHISS